MSVVSFMLVFLYLSSHKPAIGLELPSGFSEWPIIPQREYTCCKHEPYASNRDLPVVYCYHGTSKHIFKTWRSVSLKISLRPEHYELYQGQDVRRVYEEFEAHRSSWSLPWSLQWAAGRGQRTRLDPFNATCLGVLTEQDYNLRLDVQVVDYLLLGLFATGLILFYLSPLLADNPLFYYITGISFGMMASVLILLYFVLKLLPLKRPAMMGMVAGGSTLALYLFQTFYDNILVIAYKYQEYLVGYLLLSGLVSFVVCYRFGPVSNPRSKNLIQWSLQSAALLMIFFSSSLPEVTLAVDTAILFFYVVPVFRWIGGAAKFSKGLFKGRPRPRLLTQREYRQQGKRETRKGLDELREFCASPDSKPWQTVLRLRDPHRFAKFIEGNADVTKEEMDTYEEESKRIMDELLTDDSEEDED